MVFAYFLINGSFCPMGQTDDEYPGNSVRRWFLLIRSNPCTREYTITSTANTRL